MPRMDGTGPQGEGPRTGRGAGTCPQPHQKTPEEILEEKHKKTTMPVEKRKTTPEDLEKFNSAHDQN